MRALLIVLPAILLGPSALRAQSFYFGNDLSYVNQMEDCGATYSEAGVPKDPYAIFADHGANLARFRLWVEPSWWQAPLQQPAGVKPAYSDFEDVREAIARAKQHGMQVLLDFHYSDVWADPGRQLVPRRWAAVARDIAVLEDSVYQYTHDVLTALDAEGLMPELVQVGNETTSGMLRHDPPPSGFDPAGTISGGWPRQARIFNAAIRAVRDVGSTASVDPMIAIHLAGGLTGYLWRFYNDYLQNGITDFDIMGISYYYAWHGGSIAELEYEIADMVGTFPDYEIMVLETAYPWTRQNFDGLGNIVTDPDPRYLPVSRAKQLEYLTDYTRAVRRAGGSGVVFWEPAWVSTGCRTPWGRGSSHDHLVFFEPGTNAFMEEAGGRWMERHFYEDLDAPKVTFVVEARGVDPANGIYVRGDLGSETGQVVPMARLEGNLYAYSTYLPAGSTGGFRFLDSPDGSSGETVPAACAVSGTDDRAFVVPDGDVVLSYSWGTCSGPISVEDRAGLPTANPLRAAYPNPLVRQTTVSFDLAREGTVTLSLYDLTGRLVREYVRGAERAGSHSRTIDLGGLPAGPYFVRLESPGSVDVLPVLLVQ